MYSLTDIEDKLLRPMTAQIVFLIMVLLLCFELLSGILSFFNIHAELKKMPSLDSQSKSKRTRQSTIQQTLNIPIFGEYITEALNDLNVKPSGLDLTLVGIVFSPDTEKSMAIIAVPGSESQSFSTGDSLPGGVVIKQITPDGVVLKHDGELESLSLPKNDLIFEPMPKPLLQK